jgi:subtilisin family serine protease
LPARFSTFGKTVAVHAHGVEVGSLLPGGDCLKFSGTNMASPQVANLAAKLFALRLELTVAQVKVAIIQGAARPRAAGEPAPVGAAAQPSAVSASRTATSRAYTPAGVAPTPAPHPARRFASRGRGWL